MAMEYEPCGKFLNSGRILAEEGLSLVAVHPVGQFRGQGKPWYCRLHLFLVCVANSLFIRFSRVSRLKMYSRCVCGHGHASSPGLLTVNPQLIRCISGFGFPPCSPQKVDHDSASFSSILLNFSIPVTLCVIFSHSIIIFRGESNNYAECTHYKFMPSYFDWALWTTLSSFYFFLTGGSVASP